MRSIAIRHTALAALFVISTVTTATAEPVTGWAATNGDAGFSGGSELTNSPVTTSADMDTIAGNFTEVSLVSGDVLELTGSVSFDVPLAGNQFRFGLFDGDVPVVTGQGSGYVGYWVNTPSAAGQNSQLVSANGSTGNPFSGSAATELALYTGTVVNPPANTTFDYLLRITRLGDTANLFASITDGASYDLTWQATDAPASPASFTYNSVAFLMGGSLNGTVGTYTDVDVTLMQTATLEVNTDTGNARLINDTTSDFDLNSYEILSASGALNPAGWQSLDAQNVDAVDGTDDGDIAGDSIGEGWDEATNVDAFALSEVFLTGSTLLAAGESLNLGSLYNTGMNQDLQFSFTELDRSLVATGLISYVTGGGLDGDYNGDGVVDAGDYTVWRDTLNSTGPDLPADGNNDMVVDSQDYDIWRSNFGASQAAANLGATSVPEPSSVLLLLGATLIAVRRCV